MAIDVNRLDIGGLAALAGRGTPSLNLPLHGVQAGALMSGVAGGMQKNSDYAQQAGLQANQLQSAQDINAANNATTLQATGMRTQAEMAMQKNQLAMEAQRNAIYQQQADTMDKYRQAEGLRAEVEARKSLSDSELNKRAAWSGTYLASYPQVSNDPKKAAALQQSVLDGALKDKSISQEEYDQGIKLDPQSFQQQAQHDFLLTHKAQELKELNPQQQQNGTSVTIGADGSMQIKQGLQKTPQEDAQKQLVAVDQSIAQLQNVANQFDPKHMTYTGKTAAAIGSISSAAPDWVNNTASALGAPVKDLQQDAEAHKQLSDAIGLMTGTVMKTFQGSRFNANSFQTIADQIINKSNTPAEAQAGIKSLTNYLQSARQVAADALQNGERLDSSAAGAKFDAINKQMDAAMGKSSKTYQYKGKQFSDSDIDAIAKHNNVTREQAMSQMGLK
jgi:hypothetical protein